MTAITLSPVSFFQLNHIDLSRVHPLSLRQCLSQTPKTIFDKKEKKSFLFLTPRLNNPSYKPLGCLLHDKNIILIIFSLKLPKFLSYFSTLNLLINQIIGFIFQVVILTPITVTKAVI